MIIKKAMFGAAVSLFTASAAFAAPLTIPTDVNLRWGPGLEYPVQIVVPEGTVVDVRRCADFWCEINLGEYQGFMNRDVIGLGETGPLPVAGPFAQGPQPVFVPAFEDYYYDDDYGYAYGPGFGFRYYGGFHGRRNSRLATHSRQESRQNVHRRVVSQASIHARQESAAAGHNRARSQAFTHSRGESAQLRGNRDLLKQRLQNQQNVIRTQKQKTIVPQNNLQQRNIQQQQTNPVVKQRNIQQQNLQKQKTIINQQNNVQPRIQKQQQFKQKTITQPRIQRQPQQRIQQQRIQQQRIERPQIQNRPPVQRSAPRANPNMQKKAN